MFPIFVGLMSGSWFSNWLDSILKPQSQDDAILSLLGGIRGFVNGDLPLKMSDNAFEIIKQYEDFRSKAYVVPGENFYTIGYGSTRLFSQDGLSSRAVKSTDVVTKDQAIFHMKMYYNRSTSPKAAIDKLIKLYDVKLNQKFYDMICQASYASGSMHRKAGFQSTYVNMLKRANGSNDVNMLGELFKNTWISYLKQYANYNVYGLGWSRRAYACMNYIKGINLSRSQSDSQIKKPY